MIHGMILLNRGLTPCNILLIKSEIQMYASSWFTLYNVYVFLMTLIVQISLFIIKTLFHDSLNIFVSYFALTYFY